MLAFRGVHSAAAAIALLAAALAFAQEEANDDVPPKVLAVYGDGKAAYDAKSYGRALEKFDQCVDMDPSRARWHYNRGLALKKLNRDGEAREAFADSLRLDPHYKHHEIDQKLAELGGSVSGTAAGPADSGFLEFWGGAGCILLAGGFVIWLVLRGKSAPAQDTMTPEGPLPRWEEWRARAEDFSGRQAQLEHAMAAEDDAQALALVTRSGDELEFLRFAIDGRDAGSAEAAVPRAASALYAAEQHLTQRRGEQWKQAVGPRVACFFCARPLAAPSARRAVSLTNAGADASVIVCARCGAKAAAGDPVQTRLSVSGAHWSELNGFDPYRHAWWGGPPSVMGPVWRLDLAQRWPALEPLVGLAVGGLAGAAVMGAYDLAAARAAYAAQQAAVASAAASTRSSRSSSTWTDNS